MKCKLSLYEIPCKNKPKEKPITKSGMYIKALNMQIKQYITQWYK